ncbi:MAG TPA: Ger(x)C family spore germination protein [Symbiobacteriaceae bacterium]|jgi:spore germination protein KC
MRGRRLLLAGVLVAFLLTGCWNRREIETLGFAFLIGIDYAPDEQLYDLSVQIGKTAAFAKEAPGGAGMTAKPFHVWSARGRTVFDAMRHITRESNRKIWLGHNLIVVIGEEAARQGVQPILDMYSRDGEYRRPIWVVVTPGKARDVVTAEVKAVKVPAMALNDTIKLHGATSTAQATRLHDFLRMAAAPMAATVGKVIVVQRTMGPEFHYEGSAVFRGDKLAGYLNGEETRGLLWVTHKVKSGILVVACPRNAGNAGLEIIHAKGSVTPVFHPLPTMAVKIRVESNIGDDACADLRYTTEDWRLLERAAEQVIREEVGAALRRARELKADMFGFGLRIYQENPVYWKRVETAWAERYFQDVPVAIKAEVRIRRPGLVTRRTGSK